MKNKIIILLELIALLFLWGLCNNVFAMDFAKVNKYVKKQVVITYKVDGHLKANYGFVYSLLIDDQDNTINKQYSYIVLYTYKRTLETIRIKDIKTMEEQ